MPLSCFPAAILPLLLWIYAVVLSVRCVMILQAGLPLMRSKAGDDGDNNSRMPP